MASRAQDGGPAGAPERYEEQLRGAADCIACGSLQLAREAVERALGIDPSRPDAFNLLGTLAEMSGRRDEAQRYFRAALALDAGYVPARENLDRTGRGGWCSESEGQHQELPRLSAKSTPDGNEGHGPYPYRSPAAVENSSPGTRWKGIGKMVSALFLALAVAAGIAYWIWSQGAERRAVTALPSAERSLLYSRTLENVESCHTRLNQDAFHDFCDEQASLLLSFPECDSHCRTLSRMPWAGPAR